MSVRVFASRPADGAPATLDPEESHYLRRVRRLGDGAPVEVIDDHGDLWRASVLGGDAKRSEVALLERLVVPPPARELVLLLGLPEPAAALDLLPAVIELGVAAIVWVRCERSQSGPPGPARVERVVRAAMRQCGRPAPPQLLGSFDLPTALAVRDDLPGTFAWEQRRGQQDDIALATGARLLVGPEGGLCEHEAQRLTGAGWTPLGLGPHTLRTGTAAVAGLARLMFAPSRASQAPTAQQ